MIGHTFGWCSLYYMWHVSGTDSNSNGFPIEAIGALFWSRKFSDCTERQQHSLTAWLCDVALRVILEGSASVSTALVSHFLSHFTPCNKLLPP